MDDAVADALTRIKHAAAAHSRTEKRLEQTRHELHTAIVEAFKAGARPFEVEQVSPYDRNHNARLRDAAGIPPTRPATVVSKRKVAKD